MYAVVALFYHFLFTLVPLLSLSPGYHFICWFFTHETGACDCRVSAVAFTEAESIKADVLMYDQAIMKLEWKIDFKVISHRTKHIKVFTYFPKEKIATWTWNRSSRKKTNFFFGTKHHTALERIRFVRPTSSSNGHPTACWHIRWRTTSWPASTQSTRGPPSCWWPCGSPCPSGTEGDPHTSYTQRRADGFPTRILLVHIFGSCSHRFPHHLLFILMSWLCPHYREIV